VRNGERLRDWPVGLLGARSCPLPPCIPKYSWPAFNLTPPPPCIPAPRQSARASHILLKGPSATADALALKDRIAANEISFADAARDYSACPSSVRGGDLGTFKPGMMVPQFDEVIFNPAVAVGQLATAKTQFGTHIIQISERDLGNAA
jgi:peptidyl-prolyl cis-trans isomerase C